jgi:hypothetical protein
MDPNAIGPDASRHLGIGFGAAYFSRATVKVPPGGIFYPFGDVAPRMRWWFVADSSTLGWRASMPMWVPASASLCAAVLAWRRDAVARRREQVGLCPKCNYDRAGLAAGAKCPECGEPPASSSS